MNLKQLKRLAKLAKQNTNDVLKYVVITETHFIATNGKVMFKELHKSPNVLGKTYYIHVDQVAGLKGMMFIIHDGVGSTDKGCIEAQLKDDVQYPDVEAVLKNTTKWDEKNHVVHMLGETLIDFANTLDKDKKYEMHFPVDANRMVYVTGADGEQILLMPCRK